jgi:hypothetical protein
MAKVKFGMFMTDARGKVGGQVFSKNRSGAIVRTKVTPTNAQSVRQSFIRNLLSSISQKWSTLTKTARASFNEAVEDYARTDVFGDIRNPTGKNLFTRLNLNLANSNQPQIILAPSKVEVPILNATAVELAVGAMDVIGAQNVSGGTVVISATAPQTQGTNFYKGKFRQIGLTSGVLFGAYDPYNDYVAKFGVPAVTANIGFEFKIIMPNGQNGVSLVALSEPA